MQTLTLSGVIHTIFNTENYGSFSKRVIWLKEVGTQYPQFFAIEFHHDDTEILDKFKSGDAVNCEVRVAGKFYRKNNKESVFNLLVCVNISRF